MGNCVSKNLNADAIEIINNVWQVLLLTKKLCELVYSRRKQWEEDKVERTLDDIDKVCKKYWWVSELYVR